jgi:hypothetical protein
MRLEKLYEFHAVRTKFLLLTNHEGVFSTKLFSSLVGGYVFVGRLIYLDS